MKSEQELFWKEVQKIQDNVVNISLSKMSRYDDMEKLLNYCEAYLKCSEV